MKKLPVTRRQFLASASLFASPLILPARVFGNNAPSRTLNVGIVGTGQRGKAHARTFGAFSAVRVVAVCDIWDQRVGETKVTVDLRAENTDCKTYADYRELIADPEVDLVSIAAPDHWHALVAIEAANKGKHIYLEKPFAYSIEEGRKIIEAVQRNGVMLQHGTQQRSLASYQKATYLARHGYLGNVDVVYAISPMGPIGGNPNKNQIPDGYNYDMFVGPAPRVPFYEELALSDGPRAWYFTKAFCSGWITAWGSHHVDSAQFALGKDHEAPIKIEAEGRYPESGVFNTVYSWYAEMTYADGKKIIYCTQDRAEQLKYGTYGNVVAIGDEAWLSVQRGKLKTNPAGLARRTLPTDDPDLQYMDRGNESDQFKNFVDAIRYGIPQTGKMQAGYLSTSLCQLAEIAINVQRPLHWDATTEAIVNDPVANRYLSRPMRAPWKLA